MLSELLICPSQDIQRLVENQNGCSSGSLVNCSNEFPISGLLLFIMKHLNKAFHVLTDLVALNIEGEDMPTSRVK